MSVLYFAFASNMVTAQMAERCPGAELRGVAVLEDHRFAIGRRGYATVVSEPGATVYGILWDLRPEHEAALDVYEGVRHGLYRKAWLPVRSADGTEHRAIVYVAGDPARGSAVAGYMEKVVAAAEAHVLPTAYVAVLRSWLPNHE
jgi:cation transport regulator ChaC